jgi:hypothetical protein
MRFRVRKANGATEDIELDDLPAEVVLRLFNNVGMRLLQQGQIEARYQNNLNRQYVDQANAGGSTGKRKRDADLGSSPNPGRLALSVGASNFSGEANQGTWSSLRVPVSDATITFQQATGDSRNTFIRTSGAPTSYEDLHRRLKPLEGQLTNRLRRLFNNLEIPEADRPHQPALYELLMLLFAAEPGRAPFNLVFSTLGMALAEDDGDQMAPNRDRVTWGNFLLRPDNSDIELPAVRKGHQAAAAAALNGIMGPPSSVQPAGQWESGRTLSGPSRTALGALQDSAPAVFAEALRRFVHPPFALVVDVGVLESDEFIDSLTIALYSYLTGVQDLADLVGELRGVLLERDVATQAPSAKMPRLGGDT